MPVVQSVGNIPRVLCWWDPPEDRGASTSLLEAWMECVGSWTTTIMVPDVFFLPLNCPTALKQNLINIGIFSARCPCIPSSTGRRGCRWGPSPRLDHVKKKKKKQWAMGNCPNCKPSRTLSSFPPPLKLLRSVFFFNLQTPVPLRRRWVYPTVRLSNMIYNI